MIGGQAGAGEALGQEGREGLGRQLTRRPAEPGVTSVGGSGRERGRERERERGTERGREVALDHRAQAMVRVNSKCAVVSYLQPVREQCPLPEQKRRQDGPMYTGGNTHT